MAADEATCQGEQPGPETQRPRCVRIGVVVSCSRSMSRLSGSWLMKVHLGACHASAPQHSVFLRVLLVQLELEDRHLVADGVELLEQIWIQLVTGCQLGRESLLTHRKAIEISMDPTDRRITEAHVTNRFINDDVVGVQLKLRRRQVLLLRLVEHAPHLALVLDRVNGVAISGQRGGVKVGHLC